MSKAHKYGAVPTTVDGVRFASKAEARRYSELKMLEKAGEIESLECQPKFVLEAAFPGAIGFPRKIGEYRGDFRYVRTQDDRVVVEDVKGFMTPLARWKIKHVELQYGITVEIVR